MSMTVTRSPLQSIAMNGAGSQRLNEAGTQKRRSARLSNDGTEDSEPPVKRAKTVGAQTSKIGTKETDGDSNALSKRTRKVYDETVDGFSFRRGRSGRGKEPEQVAQRVAPGPSRQEAVPVMKPARSVALEVKPVTSQGLKTYSEKVDDFAFNRGRGRRAEKSVQPVVQPPSVPETALPADAAPTPASPRVGTPPLRTTAKKSRKYMPVTPEPATTERPTRRSERLSDDNAAGAQPSPQRVAHAKSHQNTARSPRPEARPRPVTVEKKRKLHVNGVEEEEKTMKIHLPFQDTPVIRRNKEMRKDSAEGHRRTSSGMRGRRASSLIDEGRGNGKHSIQQLPYSLKLGTQDVIANERIVIPALPHTEVSSADFYKHISSDLTEPRRMRCLLGWCGARSLPPKPDAPKDKSPTSTLEFQASQAALAILEEMSSDLLSKDSLSNWFGRDELPPPQIPLRRKANPRNITNAAKAVELEQELDRLKREKSEWDSLVRSAVSTSSISPAQLDTDLSLSPIYVPHLASPQREILAQLETHAPDPVAVQHRLRAVSSTLEFAVDQFAHGVHTLIATQQTADRIADRTLADAAAVLDERDKAHPKATDGIDSLRALGRLLNGRLR